MSWTPEQVLALAPDASSAKAGRDLGAARKWATLGRDQASAWGTIQGSGKTPYQASIDFNGPAFRCTCPSRKFPCKHGLGLFLVLAEQPAAFTETTPPAWTTEWLAKRGEKEEKRAAKAVAPETPADPEAAAKSAAAAEKRAAAREAKVSGGLDDLGLWLEDLVRTGFAKLPGKPSSFWTGPAARLVDAQAPGLARRVSALESVTARPDWPERLLRDVALLNLAREAWPRLEALPAASQADVRAALGFTTSQEDVLARPGVQDAWFVLGRRIEEEDRLKVQRTWLFGTTTRRLALCLSFSAGPGQPLDISIVPGSVVDAELAFFPGAWPLRALVKRKEGMHLTTMPSLPHDDVAAAVAFAAEAWCASPWTERVAFGLPAVTPLPAGNGFVARDASGAVLPLRGSDAACWSLVALAGGAPLALAGEWDGEALTPLSAWAGGRYVAP